MESIQMRFFIKAFKLARTTKHSVLMILLGIPPLSAFFEYLQLSLYHSIISNKKSDCYMLLQNIKRDFMNNKQKYIKANNVRYNTMNELLDAKNIDNVEGKTC